jgi:hypothetical protein
VGPWIDAVKRCHRLLEEAVSMVDPEEHAEWFARARKELVPCDNGKYCPTIEAPK